MLIQNKIYIAMQRTKNPRIILIKFNDFNNQSLSSLLSTFLNITIDGYKSKFYSYKITGIT